MTDDMASRDALREMLLDGVAPPEASEAMFERTFAATDDAGADLLPPDGLYDLDDDPLAEDDTAPVDDTGFVDDPPVMASPPMAASLRLLTSVA